jgi:hypothetical protein
MLHDELQFFIAHQDELVRKHAGKVLVIKDQKVTGVYDRTIDAYMEGQKQFKLGTFLIQPCRPGPDAFTVTITSPEIVPSAS